MSQEGDRRRLERPERRDGTAVRYGRPRRRGAVALRVGAGGAEADGLVAPDLVVQREVHLVHLKADIRSAESDEIGPMDRRPHEYLS